MKNIIKHIILLPIFLMFLSIEAGGQSHKLPHPGEVQAAATPPPPGLPVPIDSSVVVLIAAGLMLGGYYFRKKHVTA